LLGKSTLFSFFCVDTEIFADNILSVGLLDQSLFNLRQLSNVTFVSSVGFV
jgi:hypothetical protein